MHAKKNTANLMTPKEVAELVNCKPSTIYAWAKRSEIPCFKIGSLLRFDPDEVQEWLRNSRVTAGPTVAIRTNATGNKDIDRIVRNAIDSTRKVRYNNNLHRGSQTDQARKGGA